MDARRKELPDISKWNTKIVKNICGLFQDYSSLNHLPEISKWDNFKFIRYKTYFFRLFIFKIIT